MRRRSALSLLLTTVFGACAPKPIDLAERPSAGSGEATFDVAAARAAGYSLNDIEAYLSQTRHFNLQQAKHHGYTQDQIILFLASRPHASDANTLHQKAPTFRRSPYTCSSNCSGHQAGFDWAQHRGVTRTEQCSGNSRSFIEGCLTYVEELH